MKPQPQPSEIILFDVCNDYSLDPSIDPEPDPKIYRTKKVRGGILYTHKKYDEEHYFKGPANMIGLYLK